MKIVFIFKLYRGILSGMRRLKWQNHLRIFKLFNIYIYILKILEGVSGKILGGLGPHVALPLYNTWSQSATILIFFLLGFPWSNACQKLWTQWFLHFPVQLSASAWRFPFHSPISTSQSTAQHSLCYCHSQSHCYTLLPLNKRIKISLLFTP